jgi:hypothetical protein
MKLLLTIATVLLLASPALAESRSILVVVTHDMAGKAKAAVYSDEKAERRDAGPVEEACKALAGAHGKGSVISVYVVTDQPMNRNDRKALFAAIDDSALRELAYYGPEAPKHLAERFLKRVHAPELGGDDSDAAVEKAGKRGAETATADIKAGRPVILYYGKPWSAGKPLVDDGTGLKVEVVGGCGVTKAFVAEVDAYNATVRAWHAKQKK